ncbi:MAG: hypothetical protein KatS3mg126_0267 [Lysobacteraceae bacterium]|nr:MAG: hypothetical protein KatS3mg126_0267 [Xanthomonadaceae bacterium]
MPHLPCRILLATAALGMLGFGLAGLLAPLRLLALAGVEVDGALARVELGATYGGLLLALGVLLAACASDPRRYRAGLWLCLASHAGLGLARGAGMLLASLHTPFLITALVLELGLALAAAFLLARPAAAPGG